MSVLLCVATLCVGLLQLFSTFASCHFSLAGSPPPSTFAWSQYQDTRSHHGGANFYNDVNSTTDVPFGRCPTFGKYITWDGDVETQIMLCDGGCGPSKTSSSLPDNDPALCNSFPQDAGACQIERTEYLKYYISGIQLYSDSTMGTTDMKKDQSTKDYIWATSSIRSDWPSQCPFWILKDVAWGVLSGSTCNYLGAISTTSESKEDCVSDTFQTSDSAPSPYATYRSSNCYKHSATPNCLKANNGGYSMTALGSVDFNNDIMTLACTDDSTPTNGPCTSAQGGWTCGTGQMNSTSCGADYTSMQTTSTACSFPTACECTFQGKITQGECTGTDCNSPGTITDLMCDLGVKVNETRSCTTDPCPPAGSTAPNCVEGTPPGPCTFPNEAQCGTNGEQTQTTCVEGATQTTTVSCQLACPGDTCDPASFAVTNITACQPASDQPASDQPTSGQPASSGGDQGTKVVEQCISSVVTLQNQTCALPSFPSTKSESHVGAIVGGVVGGIVALLVVAAIVAAAAYYFTRPKKPPMPPMGESEEVPANFLSKEEGPEGAEEQFVTLDPDNSVWGADEAVAEKTLLTDKDQFWEN
eukprot:GHVS01069425.1.p1 GENE.GHVS01069425.1~~GHVS01069425.1.p1  ORF type:complete len:586 (+),score=65.86 GHVS01069425.1:410-2167(+)